MPEVLIGKDLAVIRHPCPNCHHVALWRTGRIVECMYCAYTERV